MTQPRDEFTIRTVGADGQPLADVTMDITLESKQFPRRTDADGVFRFAPEEIVRRIEVRTRPRGHARPPPRDVEPGEREITIEFERAGPVAGTIVTADGKPLRVRAGLEARRGDVVVARTSARADGTFRLFVPVNGRFDIVLNGRVSSKSTSHWAGERFFYTGEVKNVTAGQEGVELQAHPVTFDRELNVQVLGPDDEPQAGILIVFGPTKEEPGYRLIPTDESGVVRLTELPSRPIGLLYGGGKAHDTSGLGRPADPMRRVMPRGQTEVFRLRETVRVVGTVYRPDGSVAPSVKVDAWANLVEIVGRARTDGQGRFELRVPVDALPIQVTASYGRGTGYRRKRFSASTRLRSFSERVELKLARQR
ncbi:MAG: hypothetical protein AAGD14_09955 [Planctomycetota bacterium]